MSEVKHNDLLHEVAHMQFTDSGFKPDLDLLEVSIRPKINFDTRGFNEKEHKDVLFAISLVEGRLNRQTERINKLKEMVIRSWNERHQHAET